MREFRAVYMKCTQEQFERMRPKLERLGCDMYYTENRNNMRYITNSLADIKNRVGNIVSIERYNGEEVHTESEFLKACGYVEQETLQEKEQRLIKELEEVRSQLPKVGDICVMDNGDFKFIMTSNNLSEIECLHAIKLPKELQEQLKPYFNV